MRKFIVAPLALLLLAACDPKASPAQPDHHIGDTIRAQETAMNAALTAEDAPALAAFYAPDAQLFSPTLPAQTTNDAIRAGFKSLFDDPNGALAFHTADVIIPSSGDYAVSQGTFTVSYTDPRVQQKTTQTGNYLTLWRHQDDGSWKIMRDISTPDGGPDPEAQE